jgi:hypothetical protein
VKNYTVPQACGLTGAKPSSVYGERHRRLKAQRAAKVVTLPAPPSMDIASEMPTDTVNTGPTATMDSVLGDAEIDKVIGRYGPDRVWERLTKAL